DLNKHLFCLTLIF
ncbi:hypothetical protein D034_4822B, partial [Vibrio parahaemolyticus Peru-288]